MTDRPLLFHNARLWTAGWSVSRPGSVAVRDGCIAHVGRLEDTRRAAGDGVEAVDCNGGLLVPGFEDAHLHLLGLASRLGQVDCSHGIARDITAINARIAKAAAGAPAGAWVHAFGYDEGLLPEARHPGRHDLDRAAPHNPVRLDHRTGHATVFNSAALSLLGLGASTGNPPGGILLRDRSGSPTGVILEAREWLSSVLPPEARLPVTDEALAQVSAALLAVGVTAVQDASPGNDLALWDRLARLAEAGRIRQRVALMPGARHAGEFVKAGLRYGAGAAGGRLRLGHAKVVLTLSTGSPQPPIDELRETVGDSVALGFPVAAHAVERDAVALTVEVLQGHRPPPGTRHRVEHASECPPWLADQLMHTEMAVVTQPGFVHEAGDKYLRETDPDLLPWLYPLRLLRNRGVLVAAGSDAPVAPPDPLVGLRAAVQRRSATGAMVARGQEIPIEEALPMHTATPARVGPGTPGEPPRGELVVGSAGDLALLDRDILADEEALEGARVVMTVVGGRVAWRANGR